MESCWEIAYPISTYHHARVSAVLNTVAGLVGQEAEKVMMDAHLKGAALVATLPRSEAEELVERMLQEDVLAEMRSAPASTRGRP